MEASVPFLFAAMIGFTHAFEADHLVAVSNIVTKRDKLLLAVKDGIYWGLGHTSTIFLIGLLIIVGKATFLNGYFGSSCWVSIVYGNIIIKNRIQQKC